MKRIIKNLPNKPLEAWKARCLPNQRVYDNLQNPDKPLVAAWLMKEQGGLCCYTGIKISPANFHIEHLKPQTICEQEGRQEDVAGWNLLAAFPQKDQCDFGARFRGHWFGEDENNHPAGLFVHPLRPDCEKRFNYDELGDVEAASSTDKAADMTIRKLGLKNGELAERRRGAIQKMYFDRQRQLSEQQIRNLVANLDGRNKSGEFAAFCFVLKKVGQQLLKDIARERAKRRAIQQQRNRRK